MNWKDSKYIKQCANYNNTENKSEVFKTATEGKALKIIQSLRDRLFSIQIFNDKFKVDESNENDTQFGQTYVEPPVQLSVPASGLLDDTYIYGQLNLLQKYLLITTKREETMMKVMLTEPLYEDETNPTIIKKTIQNKLNFDFFRKCVKDVYDPNKLFCKCKPIFENYVDFIVNEVTTSFIQKDQVDWSKNADLCTDMKKVYQEELEQNPPAEPTPTPTQTPTPAPAPKKLDIKNREGLNLLEQMLQKKKDS